jgi:hypothetical protein
MDILIKRRKAESLPPKHSEKLAQPSPYDKRYGEWGRVELLHSEDNSVDIFLDIGIHLKRVQVSSSEWVVPLQDSGKDYNSGERDLPPVYSRVFVMMPSGTFYDCFVLCSGFSTIDQTKPYMEDDKEQVKERFTPNRWHFINNRVSGSQEIISPDEKTRLKLDYGTEKELLDPPELHAQLFHGDDPGLELDIVSGKTVDMNIFDDLKLTHNTEEKTVDINLFKDTIIHHKKDDVIKASHFDELAYEHKKNDSVKLSIFDEMSVEHKKGSSVKLAVFNEVSVEHTKGIGVKIIAYDTEINVKPGTLQINTTKETITTQDIDILSVAPIGLNLGLYKTGLGPYLTAEMAALTALWAAASQAAPQLAILDALSGGTGFITGLGAAIVTYCATMVAADIAANTAIALVAK